MPEPMTPERLAELRTTPAAELGLGEMTVVNELADEIDRLTAAGIALGGHAGPVTFTTGEDGNPVPHWPTP